MQRARPPFGYGPYEPPGFGGGRPAVIVWYRIYALAVVALYASIFVLWQFWVPSAADGDMTVADATSLMLLGIFGLVFGAFFLLAAFVPYKPWGWTVGLVAICLGLSSCLIVVTIPLLIHWMKPATKAAFGRL